MSPDDRRRCPGPGSWPRSPACWRRPRGSRATSTGSATSTMRPLPRLRPERLGHRRAARPGRRNGARPLDPPGRRRNGPAGRDQHQPRDDPPARPPGRRPDRRGTSARGSAWSWTGRRWRMLRWSTGRSGWPGPGGLGHADDQDVGDEPTLDAPGGHVGWPPTATSSPASTPRAFADVFDRALPGLKRSIAAGRPVETAIIAAFLGVTGRPARHPDRPEAGRRRRGRGLGAGRPGPATRLARFSGGDRGPRGLRRLVEARRPRQEPGRDRRPHHGRLVRRPPRWDNRPPHREQLVGGLRSSRECPPPPSLR